MSTAIIIQARMGSSRLPGKVLKTVCNKSLLAHLIERLQQGKQPAEIVVATTVAPADIAIVEECKQLQVQVIRGSEDDVLARYLQAAQAVDASTVVRITSDCPLLDPLLVDAVISSFAQRSPDYLSNGKPSCMPLGQSIEIMTRDVLERAGREAHERYHREHVTPYLYEKPGRFKTVILGWPDNMVRQWPDDLSFHRWTVDTPADFELIRRIFEAGYTPDKPFGIAEILNVLKHHPSWANINADVVQKHYLEVG